MRRRVLGALLVSVAMWVASCGPKVPPAAPGAPHYPEFVSPVVPGMAASADGEALSRGWEALQSGDVGAAERQFAAILKRQPRSDAALAGLGYAELAKRDPDKAVARFDQALALKAASASALVGRGLAYAQSGKAAEAIASFEAALATDPTLDLSARIDALRFRAVEDAVGRARTASAAGRLDEARREYAAALAASPDSAPLLKELAGVEKQAGDVPAARAHLERAISVDPADRAARLQLADLLEGSGDRKGALQVLEAAERVERSPDVESRIAALQERADLEALPDRYRRIAGAPTVTRADLAALLGVHLPGVLRAAPSRPVPLVTDVSGGWASSWITLVLRAGVMDAFPNHTFQPEGIVRRADLAAAVDRTLSLMAALDPPKAGRWQKDHATFSDLAPGHPAYDAASRAVSAKVLDPAQGGAFGPTRLVTGAEASDAIGRLETMAGPKARGERK